jgi:hypothetical protein
VLRPGGRLVVGGPDWRTFHFDVLVPPSLTPCPPRLPLPASPDILHTPRVRKTPTSPPAAEESTTYMIGLGCGGAKPAED